MKVLLINIDSFKIPNLALAKIEKYHRDRNDEVIKDFPLMRNQIDKTYVSCVFSKNKTEASIYREYPNVQIGGSGWDLTTELPPKIESINPHINYGFTTRGCIRKCKFCIVPEKEGKIRAVGDLLDLWDGKSKEVIVLDNNILALPKHFEIVCKQAQEKKIRVDFNQGLDHRLVTPEIAKILKKTSMRRYRFSFDSPKYENTVQRCLNILKDTGINESRWYVLVGFDTTFDEDLYRLNFLRDRKQRVYVQRYNWSKDRKYIKLSEWGNRPQLFAKMTYEEFCIKKGV